MKTVKKYFQKTTFFFVFKNRNHFLFYSYQTCFPFFFFGTTKNYFGKQLYNQTHLNVVDNNGARELMCIQIIGISNRRL